MPLNLLLSMRWKACLTYEQISFRCSLEIRSPHISRKPHADCFVWLLSLIDVAMRLMRNRCRDSREE